MTIKEVCNELRSGTKMHLYGKVEMHPSQYSISLRNIELGLCKPKTIKKFFNNFGYDGEFNEWHNKANLVSIAMNSPGEAQKIWSTPAIITINTLA